MTTYTNSVLPLKTKNIAFFVSLLLFSCRVPKDKNVPNSPDKLEPGETLSDAVATKQRIWKEVTERLFIAGTSGATTEIQKSNLRIPSMFVSDEKMRSTLTLTLSKKYQNESFATQCQSILSARKLFAAKEYLNFEELTTATDLPDNPADVYLIEYKLQKSSDGQPEDQKRSAIVTIPTKPSQDAASPLIAYAHGGDAGLSYPNEIAKYFGSLQSSYIIVAPAYPAEEICNGKTDLFTKSCAKASERIAVAQIGSVSRPYETDADDLLGVHNCLSRVTSSESKYQINLTKDVDPDDFQTALRTKVKKIGGSGRFKDQPLSLIFGSSRGGNVVHTSLARVGAQLSEPDISKFGAQYSNTSVFNCAANLFPPSTFVHGESRVSLELLVKGLGKSLPIRFLPSVTQLITQIETRSKETNAAQLIAEYIQTIDASLQLPLLLKSIKNWAKDGTSDPATGAWLTLHGKRDQVVDSDQTAFTYKWLNKLLQTGTADGSLAGINLKAISLNPPAWAFVPNTQDFIPGITQHGDKAFFQSTTGVDFLSVDPVTQGNDAQATAEVSTFKGLNPKETLSQWLASDCKSAIE